jgi:hypothetical protein
MYIGYIARYFFARTATLRERTFATYFYFISVTYFNNNKCNKMRAGRDIFKIRNHQRDEQSKAVDDEIKAKKNKEIEEIKKARAASE